MSSEKRADEDLLVVDHLKKYFKVGKNCSLHAVDDVSFSIPKGTTLGLVGESGCGKTTVGRTIIGLYEPDGGSVRFDGTDVAGLGARERRELTRRMQMVYQDPYASLNPFFTVGEIICEGLEIHNIGDSAKERMNIAYELLEQVGLRREHANRFPHEFSGGQRQRVGLARSLAVNPEFIVCDEAISALDVSVQAQIVNLLCDLQQERGLTYLFIAHDLSMVRYISDQVAVMYLGTIVEIGPAAAVYGTPAHPYTQGLLAAVPVADPRTERARQGTAIMGGEVTSPINPGPGCRFAGRCPHATERCRQETPELKDLGGGHFAACHF
jgi:oligopeptide transport system ATP-binding protein